MASVAGTPPSSTSRRLTGISMQPMLQQVLICEILHRHTRENHLHEPDWGQWFMNVPKVISHCHIVICHKYVLCNVTFGTVSVWAVDDKWLSVSYKLNFVFSSADVLF